jgi:hypothetical protein
MCMDDDFSSTTCIDHFSVDELTAYWAWHARLRRREPRISTGCPRCGSPKPNLHPAVQEGGEVQLCTHEFHLQVTPENTPEQVAELKEEIARLTEVPG